MAQRYLPFIQVPPLTTCRPAYIVFGQGLAPYTIFPFASGANATALEAIPIQRTDEPFLWPTVPFDAGANLTFALVDASGTYAYSDFRVVQPQLDTGVTRCPTRNDYSRSSGGSNTGAIVGGVIGGLVILALGLGYLFWRRRRESRSAFASREDEDQPIDTASIGGGGVVRAGTFNLHQVQFTEPSLDQLRMADAPPQYVAPKRSPSGRTIEEGDSEDDDESPAVSGAGRDRAAENRVGRQDDVIVPVVSR